MNSMTGFGRGEASNGDVSVVVEMKSVNNRFLDLQVRMPREYLSLEPQAHKLVKPAIQRGRLEVFVRRQAMSSSNAVSSDAMLGERVFEAMLAVAKRIGRDIEDIPLELILQHPGVLTSVEQEPDAAGEWNLVEVALEAALRDLVDMRATEGNALQQDLTQRLKEMLAQRAKVEAVADGVAKRLNKRLNDRITRLIGDRVDPKRLAQESAILADKADVSEELSRIRSHCEQFADLLENDEPVGRKLDFLLQELNREINTIGSKAAEHPIASKVVEMKSTLERMREQAANVE